MTHAHDSNGKSVLGFWIYLMTDCVLFATLFATYAVLHKNTNGGPTGAELFDLPFVLVETILLLTSSFTVGLALIAAKQQQIKTFLSLMGATFILGAGFLAMELYEFRHLIHEGYGWQSSAFMSSFFTLVGTHGLHISLGLLWLIILIGYTIKRGISPSVIKRATLFSIFWHFLDIVWIFIFTIVYLRGAIS